MLGIWNVGDVGYSGCWKVEGGGGCDIRGMECLGWGMSGL